MDKCGWMDVDNGGEGAIKESVPRVWPEQQSEHGPQGNGEASGKNS